MAQLVTLVEQHLDRQPPTVVTQATIWWETVIAVVKQKEVGLGVHRLVKVHMLVQSKPHARRVLYVAPICEGALLKDNLIPITSAYTQLGYAHQVDMNTCGRA